MAHWWSSPDSCAMCAAVLECKSSQPGVPSKWVVVDGITEGQVVSAYAHIDTLLQRMPSPSDAVAAAFVALVNECPSANPSDLWHHVVYRRLLRLGWSDNRWKRVSGFALERALVILFTPRLIPSGVRLRMLGPREANRFLATLGTDITATKVDLFIEGSADQDTWAIFGAAHVKSSIAERIQDDVPASRVFMENGLLSVLLTMDAKSYPPPHGECINFGELGGRSPDKDKARIKRAYIERTGQFDALFSFNLRTPASPANTLSGKRIFAMPITSEQPDALVRFLVEEWQRRLFPVEKL